MKKIAVTPMSSHETIRFAAEELVRYLNAMGNAATLSSQGDGIVIGDYDALGLESDIDHPLDDEIYIDIRQFKGKISGPHPRSVLFSVYRYLTECGCSFLHPTSHGERIPAAAEPIDCYLKERPSYRYRSISLEGASSIENLIDLIDWLPKVGLNSYHTQLKDGFTFFERWYSHKMNPYKEAESIDLPTATQYMQQLTVEIKKRDLIYQAMGHGWTCEPFAINGLGWDSVELDLPEETVHYLAMVQGKRQVWRNIPVNTNACYSNPEARAKIVQFIADYSAQNPEIDLLHFWLADDLNNYCECENCAKYQPSDWYVMMLNELDEILAKQNNPVKIVFLMFYELLWPPVHERIKHPDRFILLFAPVSLDYTKPFKVTKELPALSEFRLNNIIEAHGVEQNVAYYQAWKNIFSGDSFIYTYHFMTTGWEKDLAGYHLAKVLHQDIREFKKLGLTGVNSCQAQRVFFPTGLGMTVLASTLWNDELEFEEISNRYFEEAYPGHGAAVEEFIAKLSYEFDPVYVQMEVPRVNDAAAQRFAAIPAYIDSFIPVVTDHMNHIDPTVRTNWRHLYIYCLLMKKCAIMFHHIALGEQAIVKQDLWPDFIHTFFEYEDVLYHVFDIEWFAKRFKSMQVDGNKHFVNYE